MTCRKCGLSSGIVLLLVGIGFLLVDLGYWNFWGLSGWTIAFILVGIGSIACRCCRGCQACCGECHTHGPDVHESAVTETVMTEPARAKTKRK